MTQGYHAQPLPRFAGINNVVTRRTHHVIVLHTELFSGHSHTILLRVRGEDNHLKMLQKLLEFSRSRVDGQDATEPAVI